MGLWSLLVAASAVHAEQESHLDRNTQAPHRLQEAAALAPSGSSIPILALLTWHHQVEGNRLLLLLLVGISVRSDPVVGPAPGARSSVWPALGLDYSISG